MKAALNFIKATAFGGLIVIVPLTILIIVLGMLLDSIIEGAYFFGERFSLGPLNNTVVVVLLAVLTIILLCFITGLLLMTGPGKALRIFLEERLARKLPLYGVIRNLTARFAGISGRQFQPVEADVYNANSWVPGFIIEELDDGRFVVFVPNVPIATVGQIFYMPAERVRELDAPAIDVVNAITQWDLGSTELFKKNIV
jgi:uncharacterized membrane protein